jgi:hypothetical protein
MPFSISAGLAGFAAALWSGPWCRWLLGGDYHHSVRGIWSKLPKGEMTFHHLNACDLLGAEDRHLVPLVANSINNEKQGDLRVRGD